MNKAYNILVVDDSETNLVLLEAVLEDKGYKVTKAFSAKSAENYLKSSEPDLILLDLLMPNENGFDLLKKLKSDKSYHKIPIIIVTAFANDENRMMAKDLGAEDVLEKPIDIPDFLYKIGRALNKISNLKTQDNGK